VSFAIGEGGELFSWGEGNYGILSHGDTQKQPSPKRVEALRGVRMSIVSVAFERVLALTEDGMAYAWGENKERALLGNLDVERELLPKPVEALRSMRMGSVAAGYTRSYAVADTGEVWAWGQDKKGSTPLGHGEQMNCPLPKPIQSLQGVKVDAVIASHLLTLAVADDGSVYTWGDEFAAEVGLLGRGPSLAGNVVRTPQRIPVLRVACDGA
jgi:alpha-tubulin suppressor-like RCC1 family protein